VSPTSRTLATLRHDGYLCAVCESWVPRLNIRRDLWGLDVLAIRDDLPGVLGVQCTVASHRSHRVKKLLVLPALRVWLLAGNRAEVWSWSKAPETGHWRLSRVPIVLGDLAGIVVASPPRRRRKGKGERQRELFAETPSCPAGASGASGDVKEAPAMQARDLATVT
jgi:hypothetical protein